MGLTVAVLSICLQPKKKNNPLHHTSSIIWFTRLLGTFTTPHRLFHHFLYCPSKSKWPFTILHKLFHSSRIPAGHSYGAAVLSHPETNTHWDLEDQRMQPGGTATIVCHNWASRVIGKGENPLGLGRWSYITLCGKRDRKVTFIMAYNAANMTGDATFYQQ
jgi:hypothetical protein